MTDHDGIVLQQLMKLKGWLFAERMIDALHAAGGRPLLTKELRKAAGCSKRQTHMVIGIARRYFEDVEKKTLRPIGRNKGYTIGDSRGHHLVQANQQLQTIVAYSRRHKKTMSMAAQAKADPRSVDERELMAMHNAVGHLRDALLNVARDSEAIMVKTKKNKELMREARKGSAAPLKEFGLDHAVLPPPCETGNGHLDNDGGG